MKEVFKNPDAIFMVEAKDLFQLCDYAFKRAMDEAGRKTMAEREQLKPVDYWVKSLGVDRTTLWRWERSGKIHAIKLGGRVFYKAADFAGMGKEVAV